jgi:VCBS repeat-containing protein
MCEHLFNQYEGCHIIVEKGEMISGSVYDYQDNPISGIKVNAWSMSLNEGNVAITDENGHYTITGLSPVQTTEAAETGYLIEIQAAQYPYQVYPYQDEKTMGQTIATNETHIDFKLRQGNTISGTIINNFGEMMASVSVIAWSEKRTGNTLYKTMSDEHGVYTLSNLPVSDDFIIGAFPGKFSPVYYQQQENSEQATPVNIMDSHQNEINFTIDIGSRIIGNVMIETIPQSGVNVEISSASMQFYTSVHTISSGYFEIVGLDETISDYMIFIREYGCFPYVLENLQPSDTPLNIVIQRSYIIAGQINSDDLTIDQASVYAKSLDKATELYTVSENGQYTLTGLEKGKWRIVVQAERYQEQVQIVELDDQLMTVDIHLEPIPQRSISGKVIGLTKDEKMVIQAWSPSLNTGKAISLVGNGTVIDFSIPSLLASTDYTLELISNDFPSRYVDNAQTIETASVFDISENPVSNLNIRVNQDTLATVSGILTFPENTEYNQKIRIYVICDGHKETSLELSFEGDYQMNYLIQGLPKKESYILFVDSDTFMKHYYDGSDNGTDQADHALKLNLSEKSAEHVDIHLSLGGQILGSIVDRNGKPMNNIWVEAWSDDIHQGNNAFTDDSGYYHMMGLKWGVAYTLRLLEEDKPVLYYTSSGMVSNKNLADHIQLIDDDIMINMVIQEGLSICGTVLNTNHLPLENIWVSAWSDMMKIGNGVFTDSEGKFVLSGLPESSDYKITAQTDANQAYQAKTYLNVSTGNEVGFLLKSKNGYILSGNVLNYNNAPVVNAKIEIESVSDHANYAWTTTNQLGHFSFPVLSEQTDYFLQVWPDNTTDAYHIDDPIELTKNIEKIINLEPGLVISGYVTQDDSQPIKGETVRIESTTLHLDIQLITDQNGFYQWPNARQADDYIITAAGTSDTYMPVQYVDLMPSENINFELKPGGSIQGRVIEGSSSLGIHNANVEIYSISQQGLPGYESAAKTDQQGYFQLDGLMKYDQKGKQVNDYVVIVNADGYPEFMRKGRKTGDNLDVRLKKQKDNAIIGKIAPLNLKQATVYVFLYRPNKKPSFIKPHTINMETGSFEITGLNQTKFYYLYFYAITLTNKKLAQWSGENNIGGTYNQAITYQSPDYVEFTFSDISSRNENENFSQVNHIYSTTQSIRRLRNTRDDDITIPKSSIDVPPVSNNPEISIHWESIPGQKYYTSFDKTAKFEFDMFNLPERPPIRTRKITSRDLDGDDVNYYFHIATIDKDGRIGKTTSIAFRIDTTPPQNVSVQAPIETSNPNIQLQLGASGASEIYISNLNYQDGGKWQNFTQHKQWEIDRGYGNKTIFVRFRDRAGNESSITGETVFNEAIPTFTLTSIAGEHGKLTPSGTTDAFQNSTVCFTIQPDTGYEIERFMVDSQTALVTDNQWCLSDIQDNHDIQVTFSLEQYIIQSTCDTNGQIYPSGKISLNKGDDQTFVITPKDGYQIDNLTVDFHKESIQNNTFTLSDIQKDHDIFVTFKKTFSISATGSGKGTIKPSGIVSVDSGSAETFMILPDEGYAIDSIKVDGKAVTKDNLYTFLNINDNHTIHVTFHRQLHTIQSQKGIGGSIEPEGLISVASGETQKFIITPDQGYTINHIIIDGKTLVRARKRSGSLINIHEYDFENIEKDHTLVVSFIPVMHSIQVTSGPNGSIAPSGDIMVNDNGNLTFNVYPSDGYKLEALKLDNAFETVINNQYTLENIQSDHIISVSFSRVYQITAISGANGSIDPEGILMADEHSDVTFTIIPDTRYELSELSANGIEQNIIDDRFILNNIDQEHTILASFQLKQFHIISQAGDHGIITPSGEFMIDAGATQTFVIQPSVGCQIKALNVNNEMVVLSGNQYTIENISSDYQILAEFVVINNAPVAVDRTMNLLEDTNLTGYLSANDLDNDDLEFKISVLPAFGMFTIDEVGNFSYTPSANYCGSDHFTFMANDGTLDSNVATIHINITPVNDIPQSYNGNIQVNEDEFSKGQLTAFDADNDPLSYTIEKQAAKGMATITNHKTGAFVYTPYPDKNGDDSFTFTVSDNSATSTESIIDIHIAPINDLPQTIGQIIEIAESQAIEITLFAFDNDQEPLTYIIQTLPIHGQIFCMGYTIHQAPANLLSENIWFMPEPGYRGLDRFTFYVNDASVDSNVSEIQIQIGGSDILTHEDTPIDLTTILPDHFTITQKPLHGTMMVGESIIYTPETDYWGFDSFKYVYDSETEENVFTIYISPVNDAPIITDLPPIDLLEDTAISITITAIDPESDKLSYQHSEPRHGNIRGTAPLYMYYPETNYYGTDSFSVWVSDASETSHLTITLHIQAVNDPPTISDINDIQTQEDTPIAITLTAQDIDSSIFSYTLTVLPKHGSIELINNQLTYSPERDYFGSDILTYQAFDGVNHSNEAAIRINIIGGNDRPVVLSEVKFTVEDRILGGMLTGSDEENDPLTFYIQTQPQHGLLNLNSQTGEYSYIPQKDFYGKDGFEYYASDSKLDSESAYLTITIDPINDAPTVSNIDINTHEDQRSQTYQLLASDIDNLTLTYQIKNFPQKGDITLDALTGKFTFMPDLNQNGADIFTYTVFDGNLSSTIATAYIQITPVNDPPIAKDSSLTLSEDTEKQDYMFATDVDQNTLNFIITTSPEKGNLELIDAKQGLYNYIPYANQTGMDMFTFEVSDGYTHSNEATVMITIEGINDAPSVTSTTIHIDEDTPYYGKFEADDIDGQALNYQIIKNGEKGTLTLTNATTGELVYLPHANANGQDSIQFAAFDGELQSNTGTFTIIIDPINDPPIAESQDHVISESEAIGITLTASDVDNDSLTYTLIDLPQNGVISGKAPYITYTPKDKFWGIDQFTFMASDGSSDSQLSTIRLNVGVPDVPVITAEDQQVSIKEQLSMITSADDFELRQSPEKGTLSGTAPDLFYIPNANETGYDQLKFFAQNLSESITLQIYIKPINDSPVITQLETISMLEDYAKTITLNATDIEQDALIYQIDQQPDHGLLTALSNRTYTYKAFDNYFGTDSFSFSVTDGFATDHSGKVNITIEPVNDLPEAFDQKVDAVEETAINIKLYGQDIDNDPLTYSIETLPQWGGIQIIDNTVQYIPNQNFAGIDRFTFTAIDSNNSKSTPATVHINVHNTNDSPVAHSNIFTIKQGETLSDQLSYEELDNDFLTFTILQQPENGILIITNPSSGSFMYMPDFGSNHQNDSFSYHIFDGHVYSNTANVMITIETESEIPDTPPTVTIRLNKDYQTGDIYTVSFLSAETGQVLHKENGNTKELPILIDPGTYRMIIIAKDYNPFEYPEPLNLTETMPTLDIDLESSTFDPFSPALEISHINNTNGFDLRVIKKNIYDIQMTIQNDKGEIPITYPTHFRSLKSTRGTIEDPYYYIWTPDEPITQQTVQSLTDQITQNTIVFNFYDSIHLSEIITSYTVVCHQYKSESDREATKPEIQKTFEKDPESGGVYGEKALYTAIGESTFYPLMGTTLHLTVKDVSGNERQIEINIPPIPLKYLVLDHKDIITYDQEQDLLTIGNPEIKIQSTDLLKAVITYYTFGASAIGTGIQLSLELAEGTYKGSNVLFNPFNNGQRNTGAPFVSIPMLLNPDSEVYEQLIQSPDLWLYVEEKGDQHARFRPEKLLIDPEVNINDGWAYIQMNHLTAVGLGTGTMPDEGKTESECVDCDGSSNCFLEVIWGW